jgi:Protein of unknown function (DUF3039)
MAGASAFRGADDAKHRDPPHRVRRRTGEDDGYAHYARKEEIARAAVLGGTVTALCGHK